MSSRKHVREVELKLVRLDGGLLSLTSVGVGLWRGFPGVGTLVRPGATVGELETLGGRVRLLAPAGAFGAVMSTDGDLAWTELARRPVDFGRELLRLDPAVAGQAETDAAEAAAAAAGGMVFKSPTAGRFYARPSPDKAPFVSAGDVIETGHTVALLEVMKTFNRVGYGGSGLPDRARVLRVVPTDGDDVGRGEPLLELEPA